MSCSGLGEDFGDVVSTASGDAGDDVGDAVTGAGNDDDDNGTGVPSKAFNLVFSRLRLENNSIFGLGYFSVISRFFGVNL